MNARKLLVVLVAAVLVAALALIVSSSMNLARYTGEICFTFHGRTECRVASGQTREEAIRTAAEMACAVLASGMSDRIDCTRSTPTRITWRQQP